LWKRQKIIYLNRFLAAQPRPVAELEPKKSGAFGEPKSLLGNGPLFGAKASEEASGKAKPSFGSSLPFGGKASGGKVGEPQAPDFAKLAMATMTASGHFGNPKPWGKASRGASGEAKPEFGSGWRDFS
jgi:hypothetical protein